MERLSDKSIEIINALHTERLDYDSEYLPLIDCAQRCAAYEDTGYEPGQFETAMDAIKAHLWDVEQELKAYKDTGLTPAEIVLADKTLKDNWKMPLERLTEAIELIKAKDDGRLVVLDEKRKPLIWGDDAHDTILCPNCSHDLMGGFPEGESCETPIYQCPYCGQLIDDEKAVTRQEAEEALRKEEEHG